MISALSAIWHILTDPLALLAILTALGGIYLLVAAQVQAGIALLALSAMLGMGAAIRHYRDDAIAARAEARRYKDAAAKAQSERDAARIDFNIRLTSAAEEYAKSLKGIDDEKARAVAALRAMRVRLQSCSTGRAEPGQVGTNPGGPDAGPAGLLPGAIAEGLAGLMADANSAVAERNLAAQLLRACYAVMDAP